MRINLDRPSSANSINACSPGVVTIAGEDYRRSLIVAADTIVADWTVASVADLDLDSLHPALALSPEILLLGTGARLQFPEPSIFAEIVTRGIGLEVMDTAAACRTFNILLAEDRSVAAALMIEIPD